MKPTQVDAILAHLQTNDSLTPLEALDYFGCFRLAARISDLRAAGHVIATEWVTSPNGARFARYRLVERPVQMEAWTA